MSKKLSPKEIGKLVDRICFGKRFVNISINEQAKPIVIKDLSLEDRVWIDFIYEQATAEGKSKGLLSKGELAVFLEQAQVWTKADEKDIQNHLISIAELEEELKKNLAKRDEKRLKNIINSVKKSLSKKMQIKDTHFQNSLERYAEQQKIRAMVFCAAHKLSGKRYWPEWNDFLEEDDEELVYAVVDAIADEKVISIKDIRQIARSTTWRFKWSAAKSNLDNLFGKPLTELTRSQESLVYWSQVYDSAFESIDRPSQEVIDDDDALDRWFEEQSKKRKRDAVGRGCGSLSMSKNVSRHPEVGFTANKSMSISSAPAERGWGNRADIKTPDPNEVYELNTPLAKKFLAHQNNKLKEAGVIKEQDLRSDSDSRRVIGSSDVVFEKRKRRDGFTGKAIQQKFQGGTLRGRRES